jgi:hypothetical protein
VQIAGVDPYMNHPVMAFGSTEWIPTTLALNRSRDGLEPHPSSPATRSAWIDHNRRTPCRQRHVHPSGDRPSALRPRFAPRLAVVVGDRPVG